MNYKYRFLSKEVCEKCVYQSYDIIDLIEIELSNKNICYTVSNTCVVNNFITDENR